jgi:hypothetical protein
MRNLVADRLCVNKLAGKVAKRVSSAVAWRVELWDDALPPDALPPASALGSRTAVLAFADELLDLKPGGLEFAAAYLLPRTEAEPRMELQRLADAVAKARRGQSSSSSGLRAL